MAIVCGAFPSSLKPEVLLVMDRISVGLHEPHTDGCYRAAIHGEPVSIPYRVYFPESRPTDFEGLTQWQRSIVAAIMTRHCSGYQRELWAAELCQRPVEWAIPFVAYLLGDYVSEVLRAVELGLSPEWERLFASFSVERQHTRRQLNHRIINYWNLYYRGRQSYRHLSDYPGYIVAKRLGLWEPSVAPRLTRVRSPQSAS
jgi:hypothetical protein